MKVMFACLADLASAEQAHNKLNVMGIFDRIFAREFPAAHAKMFLAFRLVAEHEDSGRPHKLKIALRDADHREYQRLEADIMIGPIPPGEFSTHNQIIELVGVTFAKPGRYHFGLQVDDEEEVRVPFALTQM